MKKSLYESLKKYAVSADSVEDFLDRYYKPDRYTGRGEEYAAQLLKSEREHVLRFGYGHISRHDSVTGRTVTFYPDTANSDLFIGGCAIGLMFSDRRFEEFGDYVKLANWDKSTNKLTIYEAGRKSDLLPAIKNHLQAK